MKKVKTPSQRGRMSKNKGAEAEREFSRLLIEHGINARRGRQYSGGDDSPDVITALDKWIHFEVKRTERLNLWESMKQALDDSNQYQIPIVAHRCNKGKDMRGQWIGILPMNYLICILKQINDSKKEEE